MFCRSTVFTSVAVSVACLTSLASTNPYQPGGQSRDQQVSVGEWFNFSPPGAPFSVTLPAMTTTEKAKDIESGIKMRTYDLQSGASEYCVVWMTGLPDARLQNGSLNFLFPRALDDMLKSARETGKKDLVTTRENDISLDGHRGREASMETAKDQVDAKGYIVGHQFVALAVMHPKEEEASGEAKRFLDSFTLLKPEPIAGDKPASGAGPGSGQSAGVSIATEVDKRPVPLNFPRPNYTESARQHRVEGVVRARLLVDKDGHVQEVRLLSHLPDGLDGEATAAAHVMRFRPATKAGRPVECWVAVEVEFKL